MAVSFSITAQTNAFAAADLDEQINKISGASTLLGNPSAMAILPNGDIWVADWIGARLLLFDKDATGNTPPKVTITMSDVGGIAVDVAGNMYAADTVLEKIYVFAPDTLSGAAPELASRTIGVPGKAITGISIDAAGYIYAVNGWGDNRVSVYSPGTTDSAGSSLVRTFTTHPLSEPNGDSWGMALSNEGEIILPDGTQNLVSFYPKTGIGVVSPTRTIAGSLTRIEYPGGVAMDSEGRLYVASYTNPKILIFAPDAFGNVAPIKVITGTDVQSPWAIALGLNSSIWIAQDNRSLVSFSNSFYPFVSQPIVTATSAAEIARVLEQARTRAVEVAKTEIRSVLSSGQPLTTDQLLSADFNGVTIKNIGLVNADIAKLTDVDKTDLKQIEKVVLKFATVDKLAEGKTVYPHDLIAVGLIPQESKIKSSITAALKKLPTSSLDSFEKIQVAIASVEKIAADRLARLAAILDKQKR